MLIWLVLIAIGILIVWLRTIGIIFAMRTDDVELRTSTFVIQFFLFGGMFGALVYWRQTIFNKEGS